jgi:hypothetical protein
MAPHHRRQRSASVTCLLPYPKSYTKHIHVSGFSVTAFRQHILLLETICGTGVCALLSFGILGIIGNISYDIELSGIVSYDESCKLIKNLVEFLICGEMNFQVFLDVMPW